MHCVCVLVYTPNVQSVNSANNTLHLFRAGSEEYKQWFMGSSPCVSPFQSPVCLCHPSSPQSPSASSLGTRRVGTGRDIWSRCRDVAGRLLSRLACDIRRGHWNIQLRGFEVTPCARWDYCPLWKPMKHLFWFPDSSLRDGPPPGLSLHPSSSMPIGLPTGRKEMASQVHPLSRSVPGTALER